METDFKYAIRDNPETMCREYWNNGQLQRETPHSQLASKNAYFLWEPGAIYGNERAIANGQN